MEKEELIDINKAFFGYETKEEMEAAIEAHKRWYDWHEARKPENRLPKLLEQGKEDEAYELWLKTEFYN